MKTLENNEILNGLLNKVENQQTSSEIKEAL
jgi:ribosome assembly protein YihI (activator of Der GTPase)